MNITFISRLILFAITFFLLVKYVFVCDVPTYVGLISIICISITVLIIVYFTFDPKKSHANLCKRCKDIVGV